MIMRLYMLNVEKGQGLHYRSWGELKLFCGFQEMPQRARFVRANYLFFGLKCC